MSFRNLRSKYPKLYKPDNSLTKCFMHTPFICHPERRTRLRDLGKVKDSANTVFIRNNLICALYHSQIPQSEYLISE